MKRMLRCLSLMLVLLLMAGMSATSVFACLGPLSTLEEKLPTTDLVFTGRVISNNGDWNFFVYGDIYTVLVDRYLKGSGPAIVTVSGFGTAYGDCLNSVQINESGIFFADGSGETLSASYEGMYDAFRPASTENMDAVMALVGQTPFVPEAPSIVTMARYLPYQPLFRILILTMVPVCITGVMVLLWRRSRRNAAKLKRDV